MNRKTVALVPVKLNNERLPGKNTKAFDGGKPLINYILNTIKMVKCIDEIFVYCSDPAICDFLPPEVHFLRRDSQLDLNTTLILDVLQRFADDMDASIYVLAHATAPFLRATTIEKCVSAVLSGDHDSAMTVSPLHEFVWHNGLPLYDTMKIPRTQDIKKIFIETTGLYVYKKELITHGRRIGDNPCLIEVDSTEAVDINVPVDFMVAQQIFNQLTLTENLNNGRP